LSKSNTCFSKSPDAKHAHRWSKDIAEIVNLSPRTVDSHLAKAFRTLGIERRAGLGDALRQYDPETGATSGATGEI